jgi:hypothetical protein
MEENRNNNEGKIAHMKESKKKKKRIHNEFKGKDWPLQEEPIFKTAIKVKKGPTTAQTDDNERPKKKRNRNKGDVTTNDPDEEFLHKLHTNKIKKKHKSLVKLTESNIEQNDLGNKPSDSSSFSQIDIEQPNEDYVKLVNHFNDQTLNPDNLEDEAKVFPMEKWFSCYTENVNRPQEYIEKDIIDNINQQIDDGISTTYAPPEPESSDKNKVYKRPVSKTKKDKKPEEKEEKELSPEKQEHEFAKSIFFKDDQNYEEFKKSIHEYEIFLEILNDENFSRAFAEKIRTIIISHGPKNPVILPKLTASYIEKYMIEPVSKEYGHRPCVKGIKCIGMILAAQWPQSLEAVTPKTSFVLREFLLPEEEKLWWDLGTFPKHPKECVLCNQFQTTYRYYQYLSKDEKANEILQDYEVIVNDKDGYNIDYCLEPSVNNMTKNNTNNKNNKKENKFYGITSPFIRFSASNLTFRTKNIRFFKRDGSSDTHVTKCLEELPKMLCSNGNF